MKSIFKSVAIITGFSLFTRMLGFFFRIFLSRTIGAEALGMYQVALSVFMVLLTVVSSGFTLIISRTTASLRVGVKRKEIGSLVTTSMIVGLVASVVLTAIIFIFKNIFSNIFTDQSCMNILIILLPSLIFSSIYSVFRGAMWGDNNFFGLCVTELFEQIVKIVICVLILAPGMSALDGALSVAWSFTISCVASAILVVLLYFFYGGNMGKPSKIYKTLIKQSTPITAVRVLSSLVQPIIALILPAQLISVGYTSNQAMSLYGVAVGMTIPFLFMPFSLIGSLATALVPDISTALAENDNKHIENRIQSSVLFALFVSFLVVPVFIAVGDKFGVLIYDNALSGKLLQYSAWIMVPMGITNITSTVLNSIGLEIKSFFNYLIGEIFMFACIIFLPKFVGINALIIGMGVSALVTAILNVRMLKKRLKINLNILKKMIVMILLSFPTMAITSFVSSLLAYCLPLLFDLTISTAIGILMFVLLCQVFGVIDISVYVVQFKQKYKNKTKVAKIKKKSAKN